MDDSTLVSRRHWSTSSLKTVAVLLPAYTLGVGVQAGSTTTLMMAISLGIRSDGARLGSSRFCCLRPFTCRRWLYDFMFCGRASVQTVQEVHDLIFEIPERRHAHDQTIENKER